MVEIVLCWLTYSATIILIVFITAWIALLCKLLFFNKYYACSNCFLEYEKKDLGKECLICSFGKVVKF